MPVITLPDGSKRPFENPVSVYEVAASSIHIGKVFDFRSLLKLRKSYQLSRVAKLEDRHYSVIFALVNEL